MIYRSGAADGQLVRPLLPSPVSDQAGVYYALDLQLLSYGGSMRELIDIGGRRLWVEGTGNRVFIIARLGRIL
jgi:hypothetical protein